MQTNDPIQPTPAQCEAEKTRELRAVDIAYTVNHAVSCGTTDMLIAPTIAALFGVQVGCSDPNHRHEAGHAHTAACDHSATQRMPSFGAAKTDGITTRKAGFANGKSASELAAELCAPKWKWCDWKRINWKLYRGEVGHYFRSEIIGDVAAVPLTIMTQRFFPSLAEGLRQLVQPLATPFFRFGANHAAKQEAKAGLIAPDAAAIAARAEAIFQSEMGHVQQAVLWNMFAFPIGVLAQKIGGHGASTGEIIRNKTMGALISNGMLLGGRALAPDLAQQWDKSNSEHIIMPATKWISRLFGVKAETVERVTREKPANWQTRNENETTSQQAGR